MRGMSYRPNRGTIYYITQYHTYMVSSAGQLVAQGSKSADCHRPQPAINQAKFRGHELGRMPVMAAVRSSKTKMPRFWAKPSSHRNTCIKCVARRIPLHLQEHCTTLDGLNLAHRSGTRTRQYMLGGKRLYITAAEANANIMSHYSGRWEGP